MAVVAGGGLSQYRGLDDQIEVLGKYSMEPLNPEPLNPKPPKGALSNTAVYSSLYVSRQVKFNSN